MSSRDVILGRIRATGVPGSVAARRAVGSRAVDLGRFCEYLADYRANVVRVAAEGVGGHLLELLGSEKVGVAGDFPGELLPDGLAVTRDEGLTVRELDGLDASVTLCALGVEETGTLVLDGGVGQGRRALTLVPDYHVCLIREDQVVGTVAEAVSRLDPGRPLTWISGPSATSDIELVRVEGVHGPRRLDVVVIGE